MQDSIFNIKEHAGTFVVTGRSNIGLLMSLLIRKDVSWERRTLNVNFVRSSWQQKLSGLANNLGLAGLAERSCSIGTRCETSQ